MLKKKTIRKLTTLGIAGALTLSMSVAAYAQPGGPGGNGGGPRGGDERGGARSESNETGGSAPDFDGGSASDFGGDNGFMAPNFDLTSMTFNTDQEFTPPAGEGEEPPEKPEGDLAPEKPEGDLAPEKPEGDEAPERPERPEGEERPPEGQMPVMFDTDALGEVIAALEDTDTASELTALLDAYTAAMDAEKEALDSEDIDEDTLESLRLASDDARKALLEALQEAGMDISEYIEEAPADIPGGDMKRPEKPVEAEDEEDSTDEDSTRTNNTALPAIRNNPGQSSNGFMGKAINAIQSFANSVGSWFGNIF